MCEAWGARQRLAPFPPGEAKRGQKALSQLQTSAWCKRLQSSATNASFGKSQGGERRKGWWSISSPFSTSFSTPPLPSSSSHSPLSPPQPEPAASGSSVDALHSVTRTQWRARVEKRDLYSAAAEWLGRVQSWGGDGGIRRKQAGGCGGKIMGSKVGQIERGEGYYLRQNDLGWRIDKKQRKGEGRLRRDGVPSCPGAECGETEGWQEQLPSPLSGPPLRACRFDFNVNVRTHSPQARV